MGLDHVVQGLGLRAVRFCASISSFKEIAAAVACFGFASPAFRLPSAA